MARVLIAKVYDAAWAVAILVVLTALGALGIAVILALGIGLVEYLLGLEVG